MKIGPGRNSSLRRPVAGSSSMMSMPVMSEGIRSGVNWMRRNSRSSVLARVLAIRVLPTPGNAQQEDVAPAEQADEQVVDDRLLADDHPGHLFPDPHPGLAQAGDDGGVFARERSGNVRPGVTEFAVVPSVSGLAR